ncbi:MAG: hypothetical protein ABFS56_26080 [Pseudomonadota bacterium]
MPIEILQRLARGDLQPLLGDFMSLAASHRHLILVDFKIEILQDLVYLPPFN